MAVRGVGVFAIRTRALSNQVMYYLENVFDWRTGPRRGSSER